MGFIKFIINSYVFKRFILFSLLLIALLLIINTVFDSIWGVKNSLIPLIDLNEVYKPPKNYDNYTKLKIKLVSKYVIVIEGNERFKIQGNANDFDYIDSINISYPEETYEVTNKIFIQFENSPVRDSIFLVVSKSTDSGIFWKQIFYSSVIIEDLNRLSDNPENFRINENALAEQSLIENNDTLINKVLNYFETNKNRIRSNDCGTNCLTFKDICQKYNLPCRVVGLSGGDADQDGFDNNIGYPGHAICEIYSSKYKKWYVIDPTFGFRFKMASSDDYLNAVEISNMFFFNREKYIIQDSVLSTMRSILGRDYFKFYENIYFRNDITFFKPIRLIIRKFYGKFYYHAFHYTNLLNPFKNGYYYIIIKTFLYILILLLYFYLLLFVITKRLFSIKKPNRNNI